MITQLSSPLPVYLIDRQESALAHFVIDYGIEHDLYWVCFLKSTGECWTVSNPNIRMEWNHTIGRNSTATQ